MVVLKVAKPVISPNPNLTADLKALLAEAREQEADISQELIRGFTLQNEDLSRLGFVKTVFEGCKFQGCDFERTEWIDVCLRDCDLSGSRIVDGYLKRCEFVNCKGVGVDLTDAVLQDISFQGCNFRYSNFSGASWNAVKIESSNWSRANMAQCQFSKIEFAEVDFLGTSFFQSPLSGIDFTSCQLEEIMASGEEFRGAVVSAYQAAQLAKLWGLIVK